MHEKGLRPTVLYVDDEPALRELALAEFQLSGFDVFGAADGIEALEQLENHPEIEVLITDMRMPRMGGRELVTTALARNPALKTALVTAFFEEAWEVLEDDCPIFLKPFNIERLPKLAAALSAGQNTRE
jgi:CheY-like chemotaxis protein